MKIFKSHFWYYKRQRNGIFFLIVVIIALQFIYTYVDFSSEEEQNVKTSELIAFQNQIDSLKIIELEKRTPKLYPFNPNYITDFKGYRLGMSVAEIDRLHYFRKQNKYVNSAKEFQSVTKISDSLLAEISPYFKFPDWVNKREKQKKSKEATSNSVEKYIYIKVQKVSTNNINKATRQDFETVSGIGEVLSARIIKYRSKLQGYSHPSQLYEVWGLDKETANEVLQVFKIVEKPIVKKININTAVFKEVLKNPYIDYELCKKIFEYRDEVAELQNISELRNIKDFPLDKYDRIVIYLEAK
ncbi:helix-hairpin-helix domain-containing protein [Tenacibaculum caenipelagi]|uniref:DNA uptake protein ComE-like DNA-binding protein n=1 Tax=Tenacibaculum caenipelagi TaxID=1325435 RepID=A0A4R6TDV6_9FLAO|nr:helix-hairpin-helix domain-containing protein [Tenacibaculum caenipelagi]TDQ23947.1 DNA uptake protein ComE-like DNA-binding protein [Tenacibaculum caenipelagi]